MNSEAPLTARCMTSLPAAAGAEPQECSGPQAVTLGPLICAPSWQPAVGVSDISRENIPEGLWAGPSASNK